MSIVSSFRSLPVFQVSGKIEGERVRFVQRLMAALERQSLLGVFLRQEEYQKQSQYAVLSLVKLYDYVILDVGMDFPTQPIRLGGYEESAQDSLVWTGGDELAMLQFTVLLVERMDELVRQTPIWGCILIGGKSSRMGRPKHLIEDQNKKTWLERTTEMLRPLVDGLVVSGAGILPENLADMVRLADVPGVVGPLTGILAASRWQPLVTWVLVACDMPHIEPEAIQWLISGRRAGCWGRVPRLVENKYCEPLFAWYDFRAAQLFEEQLLEGNLRIGSAASHPKIDNPVIPESFRSGWQNINTPEQLMTDTGPHKARG